MDDAGFEKNGNSLELIVVLHGLGGSRKTMQGVLTAIRTERPDADIYCPDLYGGTFGAFSRVPIEKIVNDLMAALQRYWDARMSRDTNDGGPDAYTGITLVGHSLGGVLARNITILAYGETPGTPFEPQFDAYRQPSVFAHSITRIIMLAGMSRGWSVSSADSWTTTFIWGAMEIVAEMIAWTTGVPFTIFAVRRGAPFLIQTRLQWLALVLRPILGGGKWSPVVSDTARPQLEAICRDFRPQFDLLQLLGTQDDTVSPDDMLDNNIDMENSNYFIIEVPNPTHAQIVKMERPNAADRAIDQDKLEHQRYTQFKLALTTSQAALTQIAGLGRRLRRPARRTRMGRHRRRLCHSWHPRQGFLDAKNCPPGQAACADENIGSEANVEPALSFRDIKLRIFRHGTVPVSTGPHAQGRMADGPLHRGTGSLSQRKIFLRRSFQRDLSGRARSRTIPQPSSAG